MSDKEQSSRREFLAKSAAAAAVAASSPAIRPLGAAEKREENPTFNGMPCGYLGDAKVSRIMFGGNLVSGYLHGRDLIYINRWFKEYATEEKKIETLRIGWENGVNTVFEVGGPQVLAFNKKHNAKMQFIPHFRVADDEKKLREELEHNIEVGAIAQYSWGVQSDILIRDGKAAQLKRGIEIAKEYGIPVGVGSHSILVPRACVEHDIQNDFFVKTFHTDNYGSAMPKKDRTEFMMLGGHPTFFDNMWCNDAEEVAEFFKDIGKPWVAFKVLAAGALQPRPAFTHAFENGADFIPVGMFDFQVKENCDLVKRIVRRASKKRSRPWRA